MAVLEENIASQQGIFGSHLLRAVAMYLHAYAHLVGVWVDDKFYVVFKVSRSEASKPVYIDIVGEDDAQLSDFGFNVIHGAFSLADCAESLR